MLVLLDITTPVALACIYSAQGWSPSISGLFNISPLILIKKRDKNNAKSITKREMLDVILVFF
jgi:hypothetical protein